MLRIMSKNLRYDLREPQEQTIARFLGGLNKEITDRVELQSCVFLDDVIKLAVKVERQCKRGASKPSKTTNSSSLSPWSVPKAVPKQVEKGDSNKQVTMRSKKKRRWKIHNLPGEVEISSVSSILVTVI